METVDTQNMKSARISKIMAFIETRLKMGDYSPVGIIGKCGVGKTESIIALARKLNIGFKEIRLSHYQESDLIGLPYVDEINGKKFTEHAPARLLPPSDDDGQGILLLDEVTSASATMRNAVYQLMDSSRKLGEYTLPEKWIIVACGNGPDDGGVYKGLEPAFMSRSVCWRLEVSAEEWKRWALKNGVNTTVIAYIAANNDKLHSMKPDEPEAMIACPRNWVKLSNILNYIEQESGTIDSEDVEFYATGCVGNDCGVSFAAFYEFRDKTIAIEDILSGAAQPSALAQCHSDVKYIVSQQIARDIADTIAKDNGRKKPETVERVGKLIEWMIKSARCTGSGGLDVIIAVLQDVGAAVGTEVIDITMSPGFVTACPDFDSFIAENKVIFN